MRHEDTKPVETESEVIDASVETEDIVGTVCNCGHLCVRKQPNPNGEVIGIIPEGSKVKITGESGDWYAVTTITDSHFVNEIDGYCMKNYIAVN